jgi:hypothetical protein
MASAPLSNLAGNQQGGQHSKRQKESPAWLWVLEASHPKPQDATSQPTDVLSTYFPLRSWDIDHNRQELSHSKDMPLSPPWIRHNRNVDKHWNTNKLQYAEKRGMHHTNTVKCCWCCHVFHFGNAVLLPNVFSSVHVLNQLTNYISTLKFAQIREPIWIEQYGNDCGRGDLCWQALHQVTHALQRPELGRMKI